MSTTTDKRLDTSTTICPRCGQPDTAARIDAGLDTGCWLARAKAAAAADQAAAPIAPSRSATIDPTRLDNLMARGLERNPHLASRLEKAATLVAAGAVEELPRGPWLVGSATTADRRYVVDPVERLCSCDDFHYRGGWCAHKLAVALVLRAREEQAADDRRPVALAYIAI